MNYKAFFSNILLEDINTPPAAEPRPRHEVPNDAMSGALDNDTDPDSFLTQGIKQTFDSVQKHFDNKMQEFASSLSPEAAKSLTVGELKEKIGDVYDFANKIQVFSKAKIDSMAQDPYAIMAGFIASDPTKMAAFKELHSTLEDFQKLLEDVDAQLSTVNSKITEFSTDNIGDDSEQGLEAPDQQLPNPSAPPTL